MFYEFSMNDVYHILINVKWSVQSFIFKVHVLKKKNQIIYWTTGYIKVSNKTNSNFKKK